MLSKQTQLNVQSLQMLLLHTNLVVNIFILYTYIV